MIRRSRSIVLALVLIYAGAVLGATVEQDSNQEAAATGIQVVVDLTRTAYYNVTRRFDKAMLAQVSSSEVENRWRGLTKTLGGFRRILGTRMRHEGSDRSVDVVCAFADGLGQATIDFNQDDKIASLTFLPVPAGRDWSPPRYADEPRITEMEIPIGDQANSLNAILTRPVSTGPFPAVVLVQDMGPFDEDETVGPNKPFKDLALGLASRGIAVLRFPKRSLIYPAAFAAPHPYTVNDEVIDDAVAAVDSLAGMMIIDQTRIVLAGHGLGGMLAPLIVQREPIIKGLIILAGNSRPLEDVMIDQAEFLARIAAPHDRAARDFVEHARKAARLIEDPALQKDAVIQFAGMDTPGAYWLELRHYQPTQTAATLNIPFLIMQGGKDFHVSMDDFDGWATTLKNKPNVTLKLFPTINHFLMAQYGPPSPMEETMVSRHVDPEVINAIAKWVQQLRPPAEP